jgi:hypothetical protein
MSLSAVARANKPIPCRHCHDVNLQWRRRCLCWRCYRSRRIRALYEPLPNRGKVGALNGLGARHMDFEGDAPTPEAPTKARPGSAGKIRDMRERADRMEALHHDEDPLDVSPEVSARVRTAIDQLAERIAGGYEEMPRSYKSGMAG